MVTLKLSRLVTRPESLRRRAVAFIAVALLCVSAGTFAAGCGRSAEDRIAEAQALIDAGQPNEAVATLREVLESDPENAQANLLLGAALLQYGQPGAAVFPLEKAAEKGLAQQDAGASLLLVRAYMKLKRSADAIRALDRVIEGAPDNTAALQLRVKVKLEVGRAEEALADTQRLIALAPDDFNAAGLNATALADAGRENEARKEFKRAREIGSQSGDPSLAARGCFALAGFEAAHKNTAGAMEEFERCTEAYPTDALGLRLATEFFDQTAHPEKATALWRRAVEQAPESLDYGLTLAGRLRRAGDEAEALALLRTAAESSGLPAAWQATADFQRTGGDLAGAEQSLTAAIEASGGVNDGPLRLALANLYVDMGQLDRAEEALAKLDDEAQRSLIQGRLLLARGDASGALDAFDVSVRRYPGNVGIRYMAGIAAQKAGDLGRAEQEFREALRADPTASDAALVLAQLALQSGKGEQALQFAQNFLQYREGHQAEGLRVLARAQAASDDLTGARETLAALAKLPGQGTIAITERAWLEARKGGPRAAMRVIEESRVDLTDPASEEALRVLVEGLLVEGKGARALERVDAALAKHSESAAFREIRGAVLARTEHADEARADYEKALALDPKSARALSGLGALAVAAGDLPRALDLFERAAQSSPDDVSAAYSAAQIVLAQGNQEESLRRLREILAHDPSHAGASNDLAWMLASKGQELELALALAEQAQRLSPKPEFADTLGWVRLQLGELDAAITAFEEAVAGKPKDPTLRYHLGLALARRGDSKRALATLHEALNSGTFPDAEAARQEIARLESQ